MSQYCYYVYCLEQDCLKQTESRKKKQHKEEENQAHPLARNRNLPHLPSLFTILKTMVLWPHTNTCLRLSTSDSLFLWICAVVVLPGFLSLVNPTDHLRHWDSFFFVGPEFSILCLAHTRALKSVQNPSSQGRLFQQVNSGQFHMDQRALVWKYPLCLWTKLTCQCLQSDMLLSLFLCAL